MKKQLNTGVAVTDVSVYLSITELVVLKSAWQDIMSYTDSTKENGTFSARKTHEARLNEYNIFMHKLFGDVVSPEDVHQALFTPDVLPTHPEVVNDTLQDEIDRNVDAHSSFEPEVVGQIDLSKFPQQTARVYHGNSDDVETK